MEPTRPLSCCRALVFTGVLLTGVLLAGGAPGGEPPAPPAPVETPPAVEKPACVPLPGGTACVETHELTNTRFAAFLASHGNDCEGHPCVDTQVAGARVREAEGRWTVEEGFADHPAVMVTWYGARAVCAAEGGRLCSREEWTAACQGPRKTRFPYGNEFDRAACNGNEGGRGTTVPAGSLPGCKGGLDGGLDLSGNVWEWVSTCARRKCVVVGGSFSTYYNYSTCGYADEFTPKLGEQFIVVRCCRDL